MEKAELRSLGLWVQAPPRLCLKCCTNSTVVFKKKCTLCFYKNPNPINSEYNLSKRPSDLIDAVFRAGDCRFASYLGHVCSAAETSMVICL